MSVKDFSSKKGFVNLQTIVGYTIVLLIYVVGLLPFILSTIGGITDPLTSGIAAFIPLAFLVAIMAGILNYARGQDPRQIEQ